MALLSCGYRNSSDRMVILRSCGPGEFYLERVIFPFELLSFQAPKGAELEIWTHGLGGPELLETLPSAELLIEPPDPDGLEASDDPAWLTIR
ncbi:DUF1830 domain-containing protein [Synechococcus sp. EJ6-Ellesmere]|uniref:DUF1830 domain-containing protein n=1 Tax=Synechococcus sp. EJ6-Ellesmere TaxID=2823734 RepID=UPI0020CFE027|nr:DUF1830 domain-containing protein [Synechococcus sp. EJ6-Ellesmere]MCP9824331.1 DUF1830 domain-containing protein [Synechococcus sp. EJ6-Ellesmere]